VLLSKADFVDLKPYKKENICFRTTTIFKILEEEEEEFIKELNMACEH